MWTLFVRTCRRAQKLTALLETSADFLIHILYTSILWLIKYNYVVSLRMASCHLHGRHFAQPVSGDVQKCSIIIGVYSSCTRTQLMHRVTRTYEEKTASRLLDVSHGTLL